MTDGINDAKNPLSRPGWPPKVLQFGDEAQIREIKRRDDEPVALLLTLKDIERIIEWYSISDELRPASLADQALLARLREELA